MDDDIDNSRPDEDEEIINQPIGARSRNMKPTSNFREEEIDYDPRGHHANQFGMRGIRNSISAQQLGSRRVPIDLNS